MALFFQNFTTKLHYGTEHTKYTSLPSLSPPYVACPVLNFRLKSIGGWGGTPTSIPLLCTSMLMALEKQLQQKVLNTPHKSGG